MTKSNPQRPLPYGHPVIEQDDIDAVVDVLRSDFLTTGPMAGRFEAALCAATGAQHAVVVSSGTAALHVAAMMLGLAPGDTVVVPTVTFLATANAFRYVGAEVAFADVDPDTGLLTPETLEDAIGRAEGPVRAAVAVHLNGQSADMVGLSRMAAKHGVVLLEDACHALGGTQRTTGGERRVGGCADSLMAAFSFHPVKTVTTGEGGAITTNDEALAKRLTRARNHGMVREVADFRMANEAFAADGEPNPWYYEMPEPGFNYRASDIHCALGVSQLGKLERFVRARDALVDAYAAALAPLFPVVRPVPRAATGKAAWHLQVVLVDFEAAGLDRAGAMRGLAAAGIQTQVHYLPLHRQAYYVERYGRRQLPGADAYYARCLSVPLFPAMDEKDVLRVVDALAGVLGLRGPM